MHGRHTQRDRGPRAFGHQQGGAGCPGRSGGDPLWFGESDIVTPPFIRDAAKAALDPGQTFYSYSRGTPALRAGLKTYLDRLYGIDLHPDRITVAGSTMLSVVVAAEVCSTATTRSSSSAPTGRTSACRAADGGRPFGMSGSGVGERRWELDLDEVARAITPRTKAVYVNTPSNPTGWIMSAEEGAALLDLCRRHGLGLIADEVYHRNVFRGRRDPAPSFLGSLAPRSRSSCSTASPRPGP
ncbi:MAG: aminotransferase class I/II-fold pyridoxal phosphate-dependent enzyme [Geminicoccaceae bacterium]